MWNRTHTQYTCICIHTHTYFKRFMGKGMKRKVDVVAKVFLESMHNSLLIHIFHECFEHFLYAWISKFYTYINLEFCFS